MEAARKIKIRDFKHSESIQVTLFVGMAADTAD